MPRRAYSDPKPGAFARREMHRFYERASDRRTGRLWEASRTEDSTGGKHSMSDLVAIAYEDLPTAQQVASNLGEAAKGHDIELDDVVIVERKDDGDVKLHQPSLAGLGGARGAPWGGPIGVIFFVPLFGLAIGAAAGAAGGALNGTVIQTSLSNEDEQRLQQALDAART